MVRVFDDEGEFDVPLDLLWAYLGAPRWHAEAHRTTARNYRGKELGGNAFELAFEQKLGGRWQRTRGRGTVLAPLGVASETLAGPLAGSRYFEYYTPRGARTRVTVVGEFVSRTIPPRRLGPMIRDLFDQYFEEDRVTLRLYRNSLRAGPLTGRTGGRRPG